MRHRPTGIANLPDFVESLRLLTQREQYSLTDIAWMFGVSRERIRQLCDIHHIAHAGRGDPIGVVQHERVWDDVRHRFIPVSRRARLVAKKASWRQRRRAIAAHVNREYCAHTIAALRAYVQAHGPWFGVIDAWEAVSGRRVATAPQALVALTSAFRRGDPKVRISYREATALLAEQTGWERLGPGGLPALPSRAA